MCLLFQVFRIIFGLWYAIGFLCPLRKVHRLAAFGAKGTESVTRIPRSGFATLRAIDNALFHNQAIHI